MNAKNIERIKQYIYNQLYIAQSYKDLADITQDKEKKKTLLNFSVSCKNNASYLERFFQYQTNSSYDPIVQKSKLTEPFKKIVLKMLEYESYAHHDFNNEAHNGSLTTEYCDLLCYIANTCHTRGLLLVHMYLS